MHSKPINVFFDANIMFRAGAPPGNDVFRRIVDLVRYGFITVVTTDLTMDEVIRHHANFAFGKLKPLADRRTRVLASKYLELELPTIDEKALFDHLKQSMAIGVRQMYASLDADVLYIDDVKPSAIFKDYDRNEGLFVAQNKRDQFPDAFAFECLKQVVSDERPLIIVSDDGDFLAPTEVEANIERCGSVADLFARLGLLVDGPDPDLEPFLYTHLMANPAFSRLVEFDNVMVDGEYWVTAEFITMDFQDITAFKQINEQASLLLSIRVSVPLNLKWRHLDERRPHFGRGNCDISLYASVTIDRDGNPTEVTDIRPYRWQLPWHNVVKRFG